MKTGLLIAGLIFFLNPGFSIFDLLPDFIGCLLFLRVTDRLTPISPSAEDAGEKLRALVKVSLLRIAVIPVFAVVGRDETTFYLVFTMVFSCLEGYYLWRGLNALIASFDYLSVRSGNRALGKTGGLRMQTTVFLLLRAFFNILPDLAYLSTGDEGIITGTEFAGNRLLPYRNLMIAMNLVIVTVSGLITLLVWLRYFKRIREEEGTEEAIGRLLAEAVPNRGAVVRGTVCSAFVFFLLAGFAFLDFLADGVPVIPDFLALSLLLLGMGRLKRLEEDGTAENVSPAHFLPLSVAALLLSLVSDVSAFLFADRYYEAATVLGIGAAAVGEGGKLWFRINIVLRLVSALLTVLAFLSVRARLNGIVEEHACMAAEKEYLRLGEKIARQKLRLKNLLTGSAVFLAASKLLSAAEYALLFTPDPVITLGSFRVTLTFWSFVLLVGVTFAFFFRYTLDSVREAIDERYL